MIKLGEGRKVAASLALVVFIVLATVVEFALINVKIKDDCWNQMRSDAFSMDEKISSSFMGSTNGLSNLADKIASVDSREAVVPIVKIARVGLTGSPVRVYFSDGTAIVDGKSVKYSSYFSYSDIVSDSLYFSEMHEDYFNEGVQVIEQFVPIRKGDQIIGMISAVIDLSQMPMVCNTERLANKDKIILVNRKNGDIFVDTENNVIGNINNGMYRTGIVPQDYSRDQWFDDIMTGRESQIVVSSRLTGKKSYSYAVPSTVAPWEIIVLVDEDVLLAKYASVRISFIIVLVAETFALVWYLIWMLRITEKQIKSENSRYNDISKVISEGYDFIYYVNIKDNSFIDFSQKSIDEDGNRISGKDFFKFAYNKFIPLVPREDRSNVEKYLKKEVLLRALSNDEITSMAFRFVTDGDPIYYRAKALKLSTNDKYIIIAIENIDNSQRQTKEIERISNIVKTLSNDYTSVFAADLENDTSTVVFLSERYSEVLSEIGFSGESAYSERMKLIEEELIHPEDRKEFISTVLGDELKEKIKSGETVYVEFRAGINGSYRHNTLKFVPNTGASELSVVVGARDTEKEYSEKMHEKQRLIERQKLIEDVKYSSIIAGLSDEFDYVGHIDYSTEVLERLHINSRIEAIFDKYDDEMTEFEKTEKFCKEHVYHEDFKEFFTLMDRNKVVKHVSENPVFSYDFRLVFEGNVEYYRIRIAKDSSKLNAITVGLLNIDEEVHAEMRQKEQENYIHNMEFLSTLSDQLMAVFEVDMETGYYNIFSMNELYTERVVNKLNKTNDFFEDIKVDICPPLPEEDIELCKKNLSRDVMMKELSDKTFYEWVYKVATPEGPYKWYKERVTYKDHDKNSVTIGIFDINEYKITQDLISSYQQDAEVYGRAILSNAHTYFKINLSKDEIESEIIEKVNGKPVNYSDKFGDELPPYTSILKLSADAYVDEEYRESYQVYLSPTYLINCYDKGDMMPEYICRIHSSVLGWHYRKYVNYLSQDAQSKDYLSMVVAYDVTEEIERQKQLREALELAQSANRAKTTFLNNMSHDIRTPMNAIIGFTALAENHIDNKEQTADYLHKINQSSEHLLSLINDVLDMSRIESGKVSLDEKEESLADIMHSLRNMIQADITTNNLHLVADMVDVYDERVICDRLKLNQILINVISNSIKYTRNGGTIYIELAENGVSNMGYGSYIFKIRDTGIGMSEEYIDTIFDPFTREKSATVSGIQGSGLGMAITKNIVDMMGGNIRVTSQKDIGTEFTITLSLKIAENANTELPEESRDIKVLVVNNDAAVCKNVSKMVRSLKLKSDWCTSVNEALERVDEAKQIQEEYGVILINDTIDSESALNQVETIRGHIGNKARIIVMTSDDFSDIEEHARQLGVDDFVSKPLFPSDIGNVINKNQSEGNADEESDADVFVGASVLLVEDNELNREIAEEILTERGFNVTIAVDGTEAVDIMSNAVPGTFDIILMDIQMPVMDGYEATRRIRKLENGTQDIPIVAMTANAFEEDRKAALDAGMNEHIAKPINIPILQSVLTKFVKKN